MRDETKCTSYRMIADSVGWFRLEHWNPALGGDAALMGKRTEVAEHREENAAID